MKRGFTLIELLIVVGIIAILAMIALPNFLEAQTRAKVTRAKSDMRTVITGLELYRVDTNRYPNYHYISNSKSAVGHSHHMGGEVASLGSSPVFLGPHPITSPVAYLSAFPRDVFGDKGPTDPGEAADFWYVNWDYADEIIPDIFGELREKQGSWRLLSLGPDRFGPDSNQVTGEQIVYNPTNGSVSGGDIYRAQKI